MSSYSLIGVTEGADPTINLKWTDWVASGKPAILITKMPGLLYPLLKADDNIIVHCTITGMGGSAIEPGIGGLDGSLKAYHRLCGLLGPDRVVLRIDPIIPGLAPIVGLQELAQEAEGRVRISFMDLYPHVKQRFAQAGIRLEWDSFHAPLAIRKSIWEALGKPEVCAEPGLPFTSCIGVRDCLVLDVEPAEGAKGQRALCSCLANKTEICGRWPPCSYKCLYCYWK
jgi:hypothetical protein